MEKNEKTKKEAERYRERKKIEKHTNRVITVDTRLSLEAKNKMETNGCAMDWAAGGATEIVKEKLKICRSKPRRSER